MQKSFKSVTKIISTGGLDEKKFDEAFKAVTDAIGDDLNIDTHTLSAEGVEIKLVDGIVRIKGEVKAIIVNDQEFHPKK